MSRDPVLQATDVERMFEAEERARRWTNLYCAAVEHLREGTNASRAELVKAIDALEERR